MSSVLFAIALHSALAALPVAAEEEKQNFFPSQLDLGVPSSAALSYLGVDPSKATSPTSLHEFALGLVQGFDESGSLQTGFAFNFPVLQIRPTRASTLFPIGKDGKLLDKPFHLPRTLYLTNFSAAAVKGSDGDTSTRGAISLSFPILDRTDWRGDEQFQEKFRNAVVPIILMTSLEPIDEDEAVSEQFANAIAYANEVTRILEDKVPSHVAEFLEAAEETQTLSNVDKKPGELSGSSVQMWATFTAAYEKLLLAQDEVGSAVDELELTRAAKKVRDSFNQERWNSHKVDLSIAHTLFAENADGGLRGEGLALALGWVMPVEDMQLTLIGRYGNKVRSWDDDAASWKLSNSAEFGARLRTGDATRGFFIEYLNSKEDIRGGDRLKRNIIQAGYELKLRDGQWLQLAIGDASGGNNASLFGIKLTYNLAADRELPNPKG